MEWYVKPRLSTLQFLRISGLQNLDRRLNNDSSPDDFLINVVDKVNSGEVSKEKLTAHASTLVWVIEAVQNIQLLSHNI